MTRKVSDSAADETGEGSLKALTSSPFHITPWLPACAISASPLLSACKAEPLCPSQESELAEAELWEPRMPAGLKGTSSLKASDWDQGLPAGYWGFTREGVRMVDDISGFPRWEQCTGHVCALLPLVMSWDLILSVMVFGDGAFGWSPCE